VHAKTGLAKGLHWAYFSQNSTVSRFSSVGRASHS
jgi:hypothetical protein